MSIHVREERSGFFTKPQYCNINIDTGTDPYIDTDTSDITMMDENNVENIKYDRCSIKKEDEILKALKTIKQHCANQEDCQHCLIAGKGDGYSCSITTKGVPPSEWNLIDGMPHYFKRGE